MLVIPAEAGIQGHDTPCRLTATPLLIEGNKYKEDSISMSLGLGL